MASSSRMLQRPGLYTCICTFQAVVHLTKTCLAKGVCAVKASRVFNICAVVASVPGPRSACIATLLVYQSVSTSSAQLLPIGLHTYHSDYPNGDMDTHMAVPTLLSPPIYSILPRDLLYLIFTYVFTPWSLAIVDVTEDHDLRDPTLTWVYISNMKISGPPSASLLLTCRLFFHLINQNRLFTRSFTRQIYVGRVRHPSKYYGQPRSLNSIIVQLPRGFRRWCAEANNMIMLGSERLYRFNMRHMQYFRQLRMLNCTMDSSGLSLAIHELGLTAIRDGQYDIEARVDVAEIFDRFLSRHPRTTNHALVPNGEAFMDTIVVTVRVLGRSDTNNLSYRRAGIIFRYEGRKPTKVFTATIHRTAAAVYIFQEHHGAGQTSMILSNESFVPEELKWLLMPGNLF